MQTSSLKFQNVKCSKFCKFPWILNIKIIQQCSHHTLVKRPKYNIFFKKWAIPGLFLFIFVFTIQLIINKCSIKFCQWLESNRGPLVSKATALPTEPQPLPNIIISLHLHFQGYLRFYVDFSSVLFSAKGKTQSIMLNHTKVLLVKITKYSEESTASVTPYFYPSISKRSCYACSVCTISTKTFLCFGWDSSKWK